MSEHTPGPWGTGYVQPDGHVKHWLILEPYSVTVDSENRIASVRVRPESEANARLIAAAPDLLAMARRIGAAYPNDPGTSDLDDEQPVTITLGDVRRAWAVLAKVDR